MHRAVIATSVMLILRNQVCVALIVSNLHNTRFQVKINFFSPGFSEFSLVVLTELDSLIWTEIMGKNQSPAAVSAGLTRCRFN